MTKAIALLSGGLDSILAAKLILQQGIEVEAINFLTVFCTCTTRGKTCLASKSAADELGIKLKVFEISQEYFEIIKKPKYGYGSNMNPCLDCRIFIFKKAKEYMKENGASFLITGEVLGERPMSQRREAMKIIERDCSLEGLILRPLSAKLFEPTIPEKKGLVDREKLLSIQGRSRKPQIQLAGQLGINDYPCPAGGCLLTDPGFAKRIRDLMKHKSNFTANDVQLLKLGRHFRLTEDAKLIVGRDEQENNRLLNLAKDDDYLFMPLDIPGPTAIGRGIFGPDLIEVSGSIICYYCDLDGKNSTNITYKRVPGKDDKIFIVSPVEESRIISLRI